MIVIAIVLFCMLGGVALLALGVYMLYQGFARDEEGVWLGSPVTARILGFVAAIAGLILCLSPMLLLPLVLGIRVLGP